MILERILNDSEKIRRAEEIYYRRNNRNVNLSQGDFRKNKTYLGSKIILEMLILVLIAVTVFAVKNRNYIFSQEFLNSCAKYNVNVTKKLDSIFLYFTDGQTSDQVFVTNQQAENNNIQTEQVNNIEVPPTQELQTQEPPIEQQPQAVVMDSNSLKSLYSFVKPVEGIVSSGFGARESEYQNVTGEHKGIDIAAASGTKIKSAISGIVTQVSSEGDYGNHIRITKNNVTTLYAHCQDMYVSEGQEIVEGQEIASVGSTGNSTGPHLHFEIRINDNPINPAEVIQF